MIRILSILRMVVLWLIGALGYAIGVAIGIAWLLVVWFVAAIVAGFKAVP